MSDLTVDEGRFVLMTYELSVDGERLEQRTKDYPLGVVIGKHKLLPKFEEAIRGLKAGYLFMSSFHRKTPWVHTARSSY